MRNRTYEQYEETEGLYVRRVLDYANRTGEPS